MNWTQLSQGELKEALEQVSRFNLPYGERQDPTLNLRFPVKKIPAAVLILFGYSQGLSILYIRRADSVSVHQGQMAFPGGGVEPEDLENPATTALRETEEEVGIFRKDVEVCGELPPILVRTGFVIQPVLGVLKRPMDEVALTLDSSEVAEAVWIPVRDLLLPETYRKETFSVGVWTFPTDVFQIRNYRIWGATASVTKNLIDRLARLG